jgi:menaquinone-9 beta-reductase
MEELVDVAVVGGGPAGALFASRLARAGYRVVILEATPAWRWHAAGVFASPAAVAELRAADVSAETIRSVARPIPAMRVETRRGTVFRLTYGAGADADPPVGFARSTLDPALLALAAAAGAEVRRPATVTAIDMASGAAPARLDIRGRDGEESTILARIVVGADGHRSVVARALGVDRPARLGVRIGLSWHVRDVEGDPPKDARMVLLDGAYCGLAPVPGRRINVGIVLASAQWRAALLDRGAAAVGSEVLRAIPSAPDVAEPWRTGEATDAIAGAAPLGHRVTRRAGPGWILIGDAAGFLDPFTGEGLHRALVSARLGAEATAAALRAGVDVTARDRALASYDDSMSRRFATKDVVSLLVQGFLARPALFEYAARRLARRERVRETMGLVMGDLVPASRALDPRFLAALLLP